MYYKLRVNNAVNKALNEEASNIWLSFAVDYCQSFSLNYLNISVKKESIMTREPINLNEKYTKFTEHWSPRVIAEMNDYQFKLAKIQNDFTWHSHKETDEVFFVIEGQMRIDFRDGSVELCAGEMYVVPKGVEHKPFAKEECKIMFIEPRGVTNTGDSGGELTAKNDVWV